MVSFTAYTMNKVQLLSRQCVSSMLSVISISDKVRMMARRMCQSAAAAPSGAARVELKRQMC